MNTQAAAFTAPLPPLSRPHRSAVCVRVASRRPVNLFMREQPSPTNNSTDNSQRSTSNRGPAIWNGIRRLVRVSALSASFILAPAFTLGMNRAPQIPRGEETPITTIIAQRTLGGGSSAIAATKQASHSSPSSSTSDVEAAAMTLGAVTLGGLLMRAIVSRSRDEEAERAKLAAECARLEREEQARALRAQRAKLESVETPSDDIMSELRKRLETMNEDSSDDTSSTDPDSKSDHMRHSPIPDRGNGSAVLDRPDSSNNGNNDEIRGDADSSESRRDGEAFAKPDELEMLKRMWNLSPPDKE